MKKLIFTLTVFAALTAIVPAQSPRREFVVAVKSSQSIDKLNRKYGTVTLREIRSDSLYLIGEQSSPVSLTDLAAENSAESAEENLSFRLGDDTVTVCLLDGGDRAILNGTDVPMAYTDQPALWIIEADKARAISTGAGTRVGIVDTGADFFHPALRPWLDPGVDLVNGTSASEDDVQANSAWLNSVPTFKLLDTERAALGEFGSLLLNQGFARRPDSLPPALGHGTLVAGIVHLVAPDATLVPIKAFDAYGNTTLARIVESVYLASDLHLDVLNMSFSTSQDSPALRKAVNAAKATGMTIVSSMGNEGQDVGEVFPASYGSVVGVAATDLSDKLAPFSNYGKSVSIAAPGAYVISTMAGGRYAVAWGTSFSAPLVSGTAALMASIRPNGNSEAPLMLNSVDTPGDWKEQAGIGRLNVRKALDRIKHGK